MLRLIKNVLAIAAMLATWIIILVRWNNIPEKVPMQTNFQGEVTSYGDKWTIIILPLIALVLFALTSFIERKPKMWKKRIVFVKADYQNPMVAGVTVNMMVHLKFLLVLFFSTIAILTAFSTVMPVAVTFSYIGIMMVSIVYYSIKMMKYNK